MPNVVHALYQPEGSYLDMGSGPEPVTPTTPGTVNVVAGLFGQAWQPVGWTDLQRPISDLAGLADLTVLVRARRVGEGYPGDSIVTAGNAGGKGIEMNYWTDDNLRVILGNSSPSTFGPVATDSAFVVGVRRASGVTSVLINDTIYVTSTDVGTDPDYSTATTWSLATGDNTSQVESIAILGPISDDEMKRIATMRTRWTWDNLTEAPPPPEPAPASSLRLDLGPLRVGSDPLALVLGH